MKQRVEQIARGEIKCELPQIRIEPKNPSESLAAGLTYRRELILTSINQVPMRGIVYTGNERISFEDDQFAGNRCRLFYTIATAGLHPEEEIRGEFLFVTNGREFTVPYCFSVTAITEEKTPVVSVKDLYELYLADKRQAVSVFCAPDFGSRPFMQDLRSLALYESLMRGGDAEAALIAFLRGMGFDIPDVTEEMEKSAKLREEEGSRYSSIEGLPGAEPYRHLLDLLLDYQCGVYSSERLLPEMEKEAGRLMRVYPDETFPILMRAFLASEAGYKSEASKWMEEAYPKVIEKRRSDVVNYGFYLYLRLKMGMSEDQEENAVRLINRFYQEQNGPFGLFFPVLNTDESHRGDAVTRLAAIKREYERGIKSPFLYAEAMKWYCLQPELLTALSDFEWDALRFSLSYCSKKPAQKKGKRNKGNRVLYKQDAGPIAITPELSEKIAVLANKEKRYKKENTDMLMRLYGSYPSDEMLRAVISSLLIGERYDAEAFSWYEEGISRSISLMGLYEAYLASLPDDFGGELPRELVLYYTFHSDLSDAQKETLYANILRLYPAGSEIYEQYREQMEQFAIVQLLKGKISVHLAPIYHHILYKEMVDERLSAVLPDLLYAKQIHCPEKQMVKLLVRYPEFTQEIGYTLNEHQDVCCPVYTEDALLLFVDAKGVRHVYPDTSVKPLMDEPDLLSACKEWANPDPMLNLISLREAMARKVPEEGDFDLLYAACADGSLHPKYRIMITKKILSCWDFVKDEPEAGDFLLHLDETEMDQEERALYVKILTGEDFTERAYQVLEKYGTEGLDSQTVEKIVSGFLSEADQPCSASLLNLSYTLYRKGTKDQKVFDYLMKYYNAGTEEMKDMLFAACGVRASLADFPERVLAQMLFTGKTEGIDDVFYIYATQTRVFHVLVQAYFVWKSYRHLAAEEPLPEFFCEYLKKYWTDGQPFESEGRIFVSAVLAMGLTAQDDPQDRNLLQSLVDYLCDRERYFGFFKDLPEGIRLPDALNGCVILEIHSEEEGEYYVRYDLFPQQVNSGEIPMNRACEGVYSEPLMLFAGEWAAVDYIRRVSGEEEIINSGQIVRYDKPYCIPDSRYDRINHIALLLAQETKESDDQAAAELLEIRIRDRVLAELSSRYLKKEEE